jgi:protein-disulfide isomerase
MKTFVRYAMFLALALTLAGKDPKAEGITRQQADQILDELRQIRQLLEQQQAKAAEPKQDGPKRAKLNLQTAPMMGSKDAPLTMVEFTDFQCPYCRQFYATTFAELKKNYIDTGKMRFYSRDLPLDFHPNAMRAAEAGRCAT